MGSAKEARERKQRAQHRHVAWLVNLCQAGGSHHTRPGSAACGSTCSGCAQLAAQLADLENRIVVLTARLTAGSASSEPAVGPQPVAPTSAFDEHTEPRSDRPDSRLCGEHRAVPESGAAVPKRRISTSSSSSSVSTPASAHASSPPATTAVPEFDAAAFAEDLAKAIASAPNGADYLQAMVSGAHHSAGDSQPETMACK